jgi:predicted ATPase
VKITELSVTNFKAIRQLTLTDLQETVVIAGPNGCGKSCVFDAIRLLKSAYGGYQINEWQSGLGELAINIGRDRSEAARLLQDKTRPLRISADFSLHSEESDYLKGNALDVCREHLWREQAQQQGMPVFSASRSSVAANMRTYQPRVEADAIAMAAELVEELKKPVLTGVFTIHPNSSIAAERSIPLEVLFSRYDPANIGIIDYHGANRNYSRQQVDGVNLNIDTSNNHQKQHALYNSANKYSNLKTEMASSFIRQLLIDKAIGTKSSTSLGETLDELFTTFFPGKKFLGPQPTSGGQLLFHVRLPNGAEHDIDELSAGEKEVLYGYLRLRNSTPKNSMILIDEPELHLNPRLVAGLAGFYHKHLSKAMNNQLWLVSHSDTLIREAVGQQGFSVFHMQPVTEIEEVSQATKVQVGQDADRLVIDLIGDLAAYRPAAKMVVFEGGGDSDFDVRVVSTLFPAFAAATNCVSGGNKKRVQQLYEVLEQSRVAGHLPGRFYAITDSDDDIEAPTTSRSAYRWPSYHIENYLLEPTFILKVLQDLGKATHITSTLSLLHEALKQSAEKTIPSLVRHRLQMQVDQTIQRAVELRLDKSRNDVAAAMVDAVGRSLQKLNAQATTGLSDEVLLQLAETAESDAQAEISSGDWIRRFRGREILKAFVAEYGDGLPYEVFRDLILARMRDAEYQPLEMGQVLRRITDDRLSNSRAPM